MHKIINLFFPDDVLAVNPIGNPIANYGNITGPDFFSRLIPAFISAALVIGAIVFVVSFIVGAIQWINAGADKALIENARHKILNSLIGLVVLFSVFAIIAALEVFFGIDLFVLDLDTLRV